MASIKSRIYYFLTRRALAKFRSLNLTIQEARLAREQQSERLFRMPAGVTVESVSVGEVSGEWLRPHSVEGPGIVLYLHGGAYVFGSVITHRVITTRLALASRSPVLCINYRLAPEHPFPAGLDDAIAVYKALFQDHPDAPIALAGDSAGGGLALALALRIRDEGLKPPVALALLSPWTDLTLSNPTHQEKASVDPYFPDSSLLRGAAAAYAAGTPLENPYLSPQFADLSGLPASLVHVGESEALLDDARLLARRLSLQGGPAELKIFPGMWHVWQLLVGRMREADASMAELGDFLNGQLRRRGG